MQRIGFIGGGAMGESILKGLLAGGRVKDTIFVSDHNEKRLEFIKNNYGVNITLDNKSLVQESEIIILAVKPQNLEEAVQGFASLFDCNKLLISILAGVTTTRLEKLFPQKCKIVRVMPNTPALAGAGTSALAGGKFATKEDLNVALNIFQCVGSATVLPEKMLNAVTGLSGSGPAFVALFIEALADGGVMAGLPRNIATRFAVETVAGTAKLIEETGLHPAQLKDRVTSPAGTTIYGMLQLEKNGIRGSIMEAVLAAAKRAEEL
ncbi:MAG: pyrroline-5-carboxylate reductase [Clostridia bacterium]|nr:pyrroline-5-carboxylate reductase [Clostridia bacterium]MDD4047696.1 pyrroline-5-carboxylate reductase [Clostridia bacterium]